MYFVINFECPCSLVLMKGSECWWIKILSFNFRSRSVCTCVCESLVCFGFPIAWLTAQRPGRCNVYSYGRYFVIVYQSGTAPTNICFDTLRLDWWLVGEWAWDLKFCNFKMTLCLKILFGIFICQDWSFNSKFGNNILSWEIRAL